MSTKQFTQIKRASGADRRSPQRGALVDSELREAMDKTMARIGLEDIAKAAGCGVNTLKQARMDPGSSGYRKPPASLQSALHDLCRERAGYFTDLAKRLRPGLK